MAPASVRFFESDSLDNARPQEPRTFCHKVHSLSFVPQTCISPPGLMPDHAWVSFKDSEKVRTTGSPATGRRSIPGETWNMPPAAWEEALRAHLQLRRREAWPQLFFSYGANFSPSGQLGTNPREVFLSQAALKLDILSPGIISMLHYTWPVLPLL